ncbi:Methyltransferase-like protein 21A [Entomortierella beljakovae]|nr:Methyltransferase-like protein 21A [Entomortierella beljakovae]
MIARNALAYRHCQHLLRLRLWTFVLNHCSGYSRRVVYQCDGQISSQSLPDCNLTIEKRALQSANWLGLESLSGPGIGLSGRGGLEFRVDSTQEQTPDVFWISISSGQDHEVVPLVLGPLSISLDSYNIDDDHQVLRSIYIPRWNGQPPRTMLLKETWNNVPQGRVWDSAFVLIELFSRMVMERLNQPGLPIFAGKRILDLSAGTGLLGIFLAGLAQAELELSHTNIPLSQSSTNVAYSLSTLPSCTTVMMTDLADALGLIEYNISSNQQRIAPSINISSKELVWGASNLASEDIGELDILVASDVVYEVESFGPLLETLCGLCTPERTILYLGYKRRHLTEDKESCFFDGINSKFYVIEKLYELDVQVWCLKKKRT